MKFDPRAFLAAAETEKARIQALLDEYDEIMLAQETMNELTQKEKD